MSHFDTTVKRLTPFQNMYVGNYKVSYYKTTYVIRTFNPIYNVFRYVKVNTELQVLLLPFGDDVL